MVNLAEDINNYEEDKYEVEETNIQKINRLSKIKQSIYPFAQTSRSRYNKMYAKITEEDNKFNEDKMEKISKEGIIKAYNWRTSLELSSPIPKV